MLKEPDGRTPQYCMDSGVWHKASAEERAHSSSHEYPYTGCPMFVITVLPHGIILKEWCQQGHPQGGINHEGGHH